MAEFESSDKTPTGIEGLDEILKGGLPKNRLYLLEGDPGTGKTTIGLQFLLEGVRSGETCLYITLSESKEEVNEVAKSHGWTLDGIEIQDLTISGDSLQDDSHYTVFHPAEVELDETTRSVLDSVERTNPTRVVFDSLSEMRMLARDSLRFRRQIVALKQYFMGKNCTVILLDDRTTDFSDRQLESIAHGVIRLNFNSLEYGKQRHRLRVVKMRGVNFQSGMHDFNIETGGVRVFPRLASPDEPKTFDSGKLKSSIDNLELLLGGLDYGTTTIFTGPAGIGKTTLAAMYAFTAAEQGKKSSIYLFDETLPTLYLRMAELGMDIKPKVEAGLIKIRFIKLAELTPGELSHMVRLEVEEDDTKVVIIDSLNGYIAATPQQQFLMMQFHELIAFLNRQGVVTIMILGQQGLIGTMQSPVDLSYLADTVVLMRYFESAGAVRQAISVIKKRTGNHERTIREFQISRNGINVGNVLTEFQGILTGVPNYRGRDEKLLDKD